MDNSQHPVETGRKIEDRIEQRGLSPIERTQASFKEMPAEAKRDFIYTYQEARLTRSRSS